MTQFHKPDMLITFSGLPGFFTPYLINHPIPGLGTVDAIRIFFLRKR